MGVRCRSLGLRVPWLFWLMMWRVLWGRNKDGWAIQWRLALALIPEVRR